jgi:hypothetical protein
MAIFAIVHWLFPWIQRTLLTITEDGSTIKWKEAGSPDDFVVEIHLSIPLNLLSYCYKRAK